MEGRVPGDGGVVPVDPQAADLEAGLAGAGERAGDRAGHRGIQACAGGITGTGGVDGPIGIGSAVGSAAIQIAGPGRWMGSMVSLAWRS